MNDLNTGLGPLNVLIVDDSPDDAELIALELRRNGYTVDYERVDTAEDLEKALDRREWDIVLSDYTMPEFSGEDALSIVRARGADIPFIFVSGTIGEDMAVAGMRAGAQDYVIKGNLTRLSVAIERELREAENRKRQKKVEEERNAAQRMEIVGQLAGGVAHDFNNLLTIVIGNLDLLQDALEDHAELEELAQSALRASLRGSELTRQLLTFARRQQLETRLLDLNELVTETTELLRRTLGEPVEVQVDLRDSVWPVYSDVAQLQSVLINLAINSRDAMPDGGTLTIQTLNEFLDEPYVERHPGVSPGEYVMLAVSDTGTGISPDHLDRVFEPLFTTKTGEKGTGLGLSMVYGFAKRSRGHVSISSKPGEGTIVRLYLPRAASNGQAMPINRSLEASEDVREATILVVEDDDAIRALVLRRLNKLGHCVLEASDGPSALDILARDQQVDLLFTDMIMPGGMTGAELAREALRVQPSLKVLFATGYSEADVSDQSDSMIGSVLQKPYRIQDLESRIRKVLSE